MHLKTDNSGMTLIEIMISISIFAIAGAIAVSLLISTVRLEKRNAVEQVLYTDARIIMQQIRHEVQAGTIDYEEYYSMNVLQPNEPRSYGTWYGAYGSRFFNPGETLGGGETANPADLGIECSQPPGALPPQCNVFYIPSTDLNVGRNPWLESAGEASAFCDVTTQCLPSPTVPELYLLDASGTTKTVIARKKTTVAGDYGVGIVRMEGLDEDQNGFIDTFACAVEFSCDEENNLPLQSDLDVPFLAHFETSHFVPISPLRSSITSLQFVVYPLEDPYKAFSEPEVHYHPFVTVLMTIALSAEAKKDYPGDFTEIQVQTTISAGVRGRIDSFPSHYDLTDMKGVIQENGGSVP